MCKDKEKIQVGDVVKFYNIHPIGGSLYGIVVDAKIGEYCDSVYPYYPYAIWRPKDVYYPHHTENKVLKVIRNIEDAKSPNLPTDGWDGGIINVHDLFILINEAIKQEIPCRIPAITKTEEKWIKKYVENYQDNCDYIKRRLYLNSTDQIQSRLEMEA